MIGNCVEFSVVATGPADAVVVAVDVVDVVDAAVDVLGCVSGLEKPRRNVHMYSL